ncbi:MAG TPA: hypothetical protein VJ723_06990 [Candidatus Angelobacter sp.]|nr:hypothetical protein [Candidatus Angelobacter sp.]
MKFELHSNALAAFNEQATVVAESAGLQPPPISRSTEGFKPDIHSSATLTSADVCGPIQMSNSDQNGNMLSRFIQDGKAVVGFNEVAYAKLRKLAHSIQKTDAFRNSVGVQFVEDALFHWSLQKLKGETDKTACEHVASAAEQKVSRQEIWVPVYGLYVQSAIRVGPVTFRTITRQMIDEWQQQIKDSAQGNPQVLFKFDRDRKQLLGFAAATYEIEAEPMRAAEIASDLADKAISILRLFATANFDPQQFSYCVPLGSHQRYGHHHITVRDGKIVGETRGITPKGQYPWAIDDAFLDEINSNGLNVLSALFEKEPKTPFEELVFDALLLYSKAALVPTLAEKLLYMFAALESVLLRKGEPITDTLAERLAYLVARDSDSRFAVRKAVKEAYGVRSRFVHDGQREDADLSDFFVNAWTGLCAMAESTSKFQSQNELLDNIERYKYRS